MIENGVIFLLLSIVITICTGIAKDDLALWQYICCKLIIYFSAGMSGYYFGRVKNYKDGDDK